MVLTMWHGYDTIELDGGDDMQWIPIEEVPEENCHVVLWCVDNMTGERIFSTGVFYNGKLHNDWSFDLIALKYMVLAEYHQICS
jgi:hypothetical protein